MYTTSSYTPTVDAGAQANSTSHFISSKISQHSKRRVSQMFSPAKAPIPSHKPEEAWTPAHSPTRSIITPATTVGSNGWSIRVEDVGRGSRSGILHSLKRRASSSLLTPSNSTKSIGEQQPIPDDPRATSQKPTRKPSTLRKQKSCGPLNNPRPRHREAWVPETAPLSPMQFVGFDQSMQTIQKTLSASASLKQTMSHSNVLQGNSRALPSPLPKPSTPKSPSHDTEHPLAQPATTPKKNQADVADDWTGEWNRADIREVIERLRTLRV
ncbi:hypothetical protein CPC08DRAFT_709201 [Agrocybe pediades]|nr:hypothetical protein CPC08DRAFT_709201 [Agrocybe pediades]